MAVDKSMTPYATSADSSDLMQIFDAGDARIHYRVDGPPDGAPVVFSNSLGTDMRLWDPVLPLLPKGLRIIRYDKRGHGLSSVPTGPYKMGALISDCERLLDHLEVKACVFVGLSIGGMIAQGLAVKRLDLVRAVVLSNTAAPSLAAKGLAPSRSGKRLPACSTFCRKSPTTRGPRAFARDRSRIAFRSEIRSAPLAPREMFAVQGHAFALLLLLNLV